MQKFIAKKGLIVVLLLLCMVGTYMLNVKTSNSNKVGTDNKLLYEELINNNSILFNTGKNELDGLYYDDESDTYYFKGNLTNNYIVLNSELWRIVAINHDKSVKLIKESGINSNKLYMFNDKYEVYDYRKSIVATELDNWYKDNLTNLDSFILESEYCINYQDNKCLDKDNYKIGLLTINEVKRAGGEINTNNEAYYLYNGNNDWWIIDTDYDEVIGSAFSGFVNLLGSIDKAFVDEEKTIRPVINLKKETPINGEGTLENPYFIVR